MARDDDRVPVSGTLVLNLVAHTSDGDRRLTGDVNLSGELTVQCPVSRGSASASAAGSLDLKPITVMLVEVSALPAAPARCVHHGAAAEAPRRGDDGDETGQARNLLVEGAAEEAAPAKSRTAPAKSRTGPAKSMITVTPKSRTVPAKSRRTARAKSRGVPATSRTAPAKSRTDPAKKRKGRSNLSQFLEVALRGTAGV